MLYLREQFHYDLMLLYQLSVLVSNGFDYFQVPVHLLHVNNNLG